MIKKNDIINLEISDINHDASGVGKYEGMAIFVPQTAIGDIIDCKILKVNKTYAYGKIEKILTPSPSRIKIDCPVYQKCGGCSLRHISYEDELKIKKNWVFENLKRIGGVDISLENIELIPSPELVGYRNKAQYPVGFDGEKIIAGFYANHSHRIINSDTCEIQPDYFAQIVNLILRFMKEYNIKPYNEETKKGLIRHIYIREGKGTGEVMVCLVATKDKIPSCEKLLRKLLNLPYNIVSVVLNVNSKDTNVILGDKNIILYGKDGITDIMCGKKINVSSMAFYQVNKLSAENLYNKAIEYAEFTGNENIMELYCGTGTISLAMADKVNHITAVEIIPKAIENAKINAQLNGITNIDFICDDAKNTAAKLAEQNISFDTLVVDPPRKGCSGEVLDAIVKISPKKIIYISCNSSTLARDIKILAEHGYSLQKASAVDLFPRTSHVETVVLLSKGEIDSKKVRVEF